jgi:Bacterial Ig domain
MHRITASASAAVLALLSEMALGAQVALDTAHPQSGIKDVFSTTFDGSLVPCNMPPSSPPYDAATCAFFNGYPSSNRALSITPNPTGIINGVPGGITAAPSASFINVTLANNNTEVTLTGGALKIAQLVMTISGSTVILAENAGLVFNTVPQTTTVNGSGQAEFMVSLSPSIAADFSTFNDVVTSCTGPLCGLLPVLTLDMIRYRLVIDYDPTFTSFTAQFIGQTANNSLIWADFSSVSSNYVALADVTFAWSEAGTHIGWTSNGINTFPDPTGNPNLQVFAQTGNNSTTYYNPDFAVASDYNAGTADDCLTLLSPSNPSPDGSPGYDTINLRKYACRQQDDSLYYDTIYNPVPVTDASDGGAAAGTLLVSDTTLTGTLTVVSTTDEPMGATTTFSAGLRTSNSAGNGLNGFNVRAADGSPFGNVWYGITTLATLDVNLTGVFSASNWSIQGGAVTFNDPGLACQQGGPGTQVLCNPSATGGGFTPTGGHLSWGMDTDGAGTGQTAATPIDVRNVDGSASIATLGGVLASLAIAPDGTITTNQGEFRIGSGNTGGGCPTSIRWGGDTDSGPGTAIGISCGTLSAGPLSISGVASVEPIDLTPDAFTFVDQANVPSSTVITSAPVSISGMDANFAVGVSVTSGSYSVGCTGSFTSSPGSIRSGQTVCVRHSSAAAGNTQTNTTLTIGGVSDVFTSTTTVDTTPESFGFPSQSNVGRSLIVTSAAVTVSGINSPATIAVSGDPTSEYSINGGAFTNGPGQVSTGASVRVRHTSAGTFASNVTTALVIGGVQGFFTSTTESEDTSPDPFGFGTQFAVALSVVVESGSTVVTGINSPAPIAVASGSAAGSAYSIGCSGVYVSTAGVVFNGQTVCVRHVSAATFSTLTETRLAIGSVTGSFFSQTVDPDTTGLPFAFIDLENVRPDTEQISNSIVVTGINTAAPISVLLGEYSINGGPFGSAPGLVNNGDSVRVRHTSANQANASVTTTLTIGGISDAFTSTTAESVAIDDAVVTSIGESIQVDVLENDTGFTDPVILADWTPFALHGTVQVTGSPGPQLGARITYTPNPGFTGVDTFGYVVDDDTRIDFGLVTVTVIVDPDGDGRDAADDNCLNVANPGQRDSNGDGYGNLCDADLNNNGIVNAADLALFRTAFGSTNADADLNGNGVVNFSDLALFRALFGKAPGPSGVAP